MSGIKLHNRLQGSSLVEVIVMMVIMSMSIVGVYSMVANGQKLARLTDNRLIAGNLAREGLEAVGALRDTYQLRANETPGCFFTIDLSANPAKCYQTGISTKYALSDDLTLLPTTQVLPVCINARGWYSQTCSTATPRCLKADQRSCRTQFVRSILFRPCGSVPVSQCVTAHVDVTWGTKSEETFSLEQIFTKH